MASTDQVKSNGPIPVKLMVMFVVLVPSLQIAPPPLICAWGHIAPGAVYCVVNEHNELSEKTAERVWDDPSHGIFEME